MMMFFSLRGLLKTLVLGLLIMILSPTAGAAPLNWGAWRRMPVFNDGRIMPLETFARDIVQEVCGTSRPFIVIDDLLLAELERMGTEEETEEELESEAFSTSPFAALAEAKSQSEHFPQPKAADDVRNILGSRERLLDQTEVKKSEEHEQVHVKKRKALTRRDVARITQRIRFLITEGGRRFEPYEILFSWLVEPEIWDFIPFLPAANEALRQDILNIRPRNRFGFLLQYASISQVARSEKFQERLARLHESMRTSPATRPREPSSLDRSVLALDRSLSLFHELTFRPDRLYPERCALQVQSLFGGGQDRSGALMLLVESLTPLFTLDGRRQEMPEDREVIAMLRDLLTRARDFSQLFAPEDAGGESPALDIPRIEKGFEDLLEQADRLTALASMLMQRFYPEGKFPMPPNVPAPNPAVLDDVFGSPEIMERHRSLISKALLEFHYGAKTFRAGIEAAYVALYDNGTTLRVLPVLSTEPLRRDRDAMQTPYPRSPWVSLGTLLYANDAMLRRFVDPAYHKPADASEVIGRRENRELGSQQTSSRPSDVYGSVDMSPGKSEGETLDRIGKEDDATVASQPNDMPPLPTENAGSSSTVVRILSRDETAGAIEKEESSLVLKPSGSSAMAIDTIRKAFKQAGEGYAMVDSIEANTVFGRAMNELVHTVREVGGRIESLRQTMGLNERIDPEILAKTAYPMTPGIILTEFRYHRLAPVFWMWVFSGAALLCGLAAMYLSRFRHGLIESEGELSRSFQGEAENTDVLRRYRYDEGVFNIAIVFLLLAVGITFLGGLMRARISGWAPVTNMYETVVLMGFSAALIGLWYTMQPLLAPLFRKAWSLARFPSPASVSGTRRELERRRMGVDEPFPNSMRATLLGNLLLLPPRIILMFLVFVWTIRIGYGEGTADAGVLVALGKLFTIHDPIDWVVVLVSMGTVVCLLPRFVLAVAIMPWLWYRPIGLAVEAGILADKETVPTDSNRSLNRMLEEEMTGGAALSREMSAGRRWKEEVLGKMYERKIFLLVGAAVAVLAGLIASCNTEFNPAIRPLAAVLRSNFWLAVHVTAIIVSYAAALVAWGLAVVALGAYTFGAYRRNRRADGKQELQPPPLCRMLSGYILQMLRISVLLLALGTILGARWADYSWGRFWGWDPKEVWALITLLTLAIILHGRIARLYGVFGTIVGASLGSIAVIMTWYGINFVFKAGLHAYAGETNTGATFFLLAFIALNLLWLLAAVFRYNAETYAIQEETAEAAT